MLSPTIIKHIERVLKHEGGWVNHPNDPGGETNLGITWPTLKRAILDSIVEPDTTIRNLYRDQAYRIYYEYYYKPWEWMRNDALIFQMFDAYVNHAPSSAIRMLQRAVGVSADGQLGPVTKGAVFKQEIEPLLFKFLAERQDHFTNLDTFGSFGKGWMRRVADNMRYAAEDL